MVRTKKSAWLGSSSGKKGGAHPFYGKFGLGFLLAREGLFSKSKAIRYASWSGMARTYFVNDHKTHTGSLLFTQTLPFNSEPGGAFSLAVNRILAGK